MLFRKAVSVAVVGTAMSLAGLGGAFAGGLGSGGGGAGTDAEIGRRISQGLDSPATSNPVEGSAFYGSDDRQGIGYGNYPYGNGNLLSSLLGPRYAHHDGYAYDGEPAVDRRGYRLRPYDGYGAQAQVGRSVARSGATCSTPIRVCGLSHQAFLGGSCSCKASDGRSRGHVTP